MKRPSLPHKDFINLWNDSSSAIAVAKVMGTTPSTVVTRAYRLRCRGFDLKKMKKHQDPTRAGVRSQAASKRDALVFQALASTIPAQFFRDHADTSWEWMASQTGLDTRTLKKIALKRGFTGAIAGAKKVRRFDCCPLLCNYLDGLLLSDAGLEKRSTKCLSQESISRDWLRQIEVYLLRYGIESTLRPVKQRDKGRPSFRLRTRTYQTFSSFHCRWYPNGGPKVIPRDLDVSSPDLLRNLYLGDGTMGSVLEICTEGFRDQDVEWLRDEFNRVHAWGVDTKRVKAGLRLKIYAKYRNLFYDLIEYDIPPSLQHRFKRSPGRPQR